MFSMYVLFHVIQSFLAPIYITLSIVAVSSRFVPILQVLASHGKTRRRQIENVAKTVSAKAPIVKLQRQIFKPQRIINFVTSSPHAWVPKYWFQHFYILGLLVVVLVMAVDSTFDGTVRTSVSITIPTSASLQSMYMSPRNVATILLLIHLIRRAYECQLFLPEPATATQSRARRRSSSETFPSTSSSTSSSSFPSSDDSNSKMHIAGYALGIIHYVLLPFCFVRVPPRKPSLGNDIERHDSGNDQPIIGDIIMIVIVALALSNLWLQHEQNFYHRILSELKSKKIRSLKENDDDQRTQLTKSKCSTKFSIGTSSSAIATSTTKMNPHNHDTPNHHRRRHYSTPPRVRLWKYVWCPHYLVEVLLYLTFSLILEFGERYDHNDCLTYALRHQQTDNTCTSEEILTVSSSSSSCAAPSAASFCGGDDVPTVSTATMGMMMWRFISTFIYQRHRHWLLFLWVTTNLTVSAVNNADWYRDVQKQQQEGRRQHRHGSDFRWAITPFII